MIDQNGNVLSRTGEKGLTGNLSPDMLEFQMQVEQRLEDRAQALLDKSLGTKNAMVRVSATLDFAKTEKTEETFDPEEPVIRSEQVSDEKSGSEITGGVPGVQSNLEGNSNQTAGASPPTSRSQRTTNYEISKVVSKTINPVGTVSKLSVSVLVADKIIPAKDKEPTKTEPRQPAELKALETMVASALGLDTARGDKIEVTSMPFLESAEGVEWLRAWPPISSISTCRSSGTACLFLADCSSIFLMIRPLMKTLRRDVTQHYKTVEQMEAEQARQAKASEPAEPALWWAGLPTKRHGITAHDPLEKLQMGVETDPAFSAHVLKSWIHEQN